MAPLPRPHPLGAPALRASFGAFGPSIVHLCPGIEKSKIRYPKGPTVCGHAKLHGRVPRVLRRTPGSSNSNQEQRRSLEVLPEVVYNELHNQ